jgi:pyrimidine deaminase RibD-like protein
MSTHAEMAALLGLESGKNEERKELARGSDLFVVRLGGRALEPLDSIWKRNSRCVPCLYLSCVPCVVSCCIHLANAAHPRPTIGRPCPVCVEWMYRYGVRRVFYTVGQPSNRYALTVVLVLVFMLKSNEVTEVMRIFT